jgi:hypothetical protein
VSGWVKRWVAGCQFCILLTTVNRVYPQNYLFFSSPFHNQTCFSLTGRLLLLLAMRTLLLCTCLCLVLSSNPARCDNEEEDTYQSEFGEKIDRIRTTPIKVREGTKQ